MFGIEKNKRGRFDNYRLVDSDTKEYVEVISGLGSNVTDLVLNKNGTLYSIIEGVTDDELNNGNIKSRSTKLIPFPNRIENGRYEFRGKYYHLPLNHGKHAIHGLISDKTLEVISTNEDKNGASIKFGYSYDGSLPGYPFKYDTSITNSLVKGRGFICDTVITNIDVSPIPVGDGWHPYFRTKGKVDRLQLKIPSKYRVEVNKLIPTGNLIPEEYTKPVTIGDTKYDTGFVLEENEGITATEIFDPELDIKIVVWQETGKWKYNYLQVYIPDNRSSIAIEPMSCAADAFNNKMGLIILEPGQSFYATCGVNLE
jgi:aldose 1-epimerase